MLTRFFVCVLLLLGTGLINGCAHRTEVFSEKEQRINNLSKRLQQLAPNSTPQAAQHLAEIAVNAASQLRDNYRVTLAPWLHNIEVNSGIKQRGLCFHYAKDLAAAIQPSLTPYWQMHRVQARPKQLLEHNAIVITGKGQPWQSGIVLDAWRNTGVLYFGAVIKDKYPWQLKTKISRPPIQEVRHGINPD